MKNKFLIGAILGLTTIALFLAASFFMVSETAGDLVGKWRYQEQEFYVQINRNRTAYQCRFFVNDMITVQGKLIAADKIKWEDPIVWDVTTGKKTGEPLTGRVERIINLGKDVMLLSGSLGSFSLGRTNDARIDECIKLSKKFSR